MGGPFSLHSFVAGLLAALVGFSSAFAIVLNGLHKVGADPTQAASGLAAVTIGMGLTSVALSLRFKMPIACAWSTPGAAMLAGAVAPAGGFSEAVGAFLVSAVLLTAAGLWRPLADLVRRIPSALAAAMLAGVLTPLCLAPVKASAATPAFALPVILVWAVTARLARLYAIPAALAAAAVVIALQRPILPGAEALAPHLMLIPPSFSLASVIGIALPLAIVTMASQNLPGFAVLKINGYEPPAGPVLTTTGVASLLSAPFGGHALNLAAISAALVAGQDAHPDSTKRWGAAVVNGVALVVLGLGASAATALVAAAPPLLIETVAGLALLPALASALAGALATEDHREAAVVTFLVSASGVAIAGIGGAFWGLVAGAAMLVLRKIGPLKRPTPIKRSEP